MPRGEEKEAEEGEEMEEEVEGDLSVEAQPCGCCLPDTDHTQAGAAQEPSHAVGSQGKLRSQRHSSQKEEEEKEDQ